MNTPLGLAEAGVTSAVAAALDGPAGVDATLTIPGGAALAVRVGLFVDEQPNDGIQRRGATILVAKAECADEPVDGTTILVGSETWTVRTALEQVALWRCRAWANG